MTQNTKYKILNTNLIHRIKLRTWIGGLLMLVLLPIIIFSIFDASAAPSPPTAYWKLDDGTGTTVQNSGTTSTTGTITGATWANEDLCLNGKCLKFDGDGDYIDFGDNYDMGTNDMTISLWFRTTDTDYSLIAKSFYAATDNRYAIINESGAGLTGFFDSGPNNTTSPAVSTVSDNRWHHAEAVYDRDGSLTLYIDGQTSGSVSISAESADNVQGANNLYVGAYNDAGGTSPHATLLEFSGFIDEIKIYTYARSSDQIKTDYVKNGSNRGSSAVMGAQDTNFLSSGLIGYWKMDETSWTNDCATDTVLDSSGNNFHGDACPATTGPTGGATGKFGNAGNFDGSDDKVSVPDNSTLDLTEAVTLSAWINPDVNSAYYRIIAKIDGGETGGYMMDIATFGAIRLRINSTDCITASDQAPSGVWSHVMATYDRNTTRIYVNGELKKECSATAAISTNNQALTIGDRPDGNSRFDGLIDEVRVYNRALSSMEAKNLSSWAPGPTHYWKMDENVSGDAKNLYDSSGGGKTATTDSADGTGVNCTQPGKFGTGCDLDGSDDDIRVATPGLPTKDFTYSMWFSKDAVSTSDTLLVVPDSGGGNELRLLVDDNVTYNVDGGGNVGGTTTFTSGSWNHVALTRTGSSIKLYVNGQLDGSSTDADALDFSTCTLYIGLDIDSGVGCTTNPNDYFNGKVDDFKVYNYGRTASQVIEDMNGGHPVGGSPIGSQNIYWKFDEGNGTTAYNAITGNTNGTLTNMSSPPTSTSGWTANGKVDKALVFDGSNDNVVIATASDSFVDFNGSESFSGSAWVYSTTLPASGDQDAIIAKWDSTTATSEGYKLFIDGDSTTAHFGVTISDESASQTISASASDNTASASTWYHVAFTFNGGTAGAAGDLKLYVNGKLVASNSVNASFLGLEDVTADFTVGDYDATDAVSTNTAFTGYIDEVQIFPSVLTNEQVEIVRNANATSNFGSTTDEDEVDLASEGNPPVAYFNFDENTGSTAKNTGSGTGANDGTFSNTAKYWQGKNGSGVYFDGDSTGNGTGVIFPDNAWDSLSQGSVEFWFKAKDSGDSWQEMFAVANGPNGSLAIEMAYVPASNQVQIWTTGCASGNIDQSAGTGAVVPNPTEWHHYAYIVDATTTYLYLDGILTATSTADCFFDEVSSGTNTNYSVGCILWTSDTACFSSEMFEGVMDDVKIYDYARTQAQLNYDINRGFPISHWKFDECSGTTAYDSGPDGLSGTLTPGASGNTSAGDCSTGSTMRGTGADSKYNSGLDFDGTDDYVTVADTNELVDFESGSQDFSLFAWIKRDNTGEQNIISFEEADNDGWRLQLNSSNQVVCSVDAVDITSTSSITDTNWHFVGCTIDRDGNGQTYIDGKANGSTQAISSEAMAITATSFSIGTRGYTSANYFNGLIDEVQIYSYALTAAQIRKMYNQNAGTRFGPLIGRP